MMKEPEIKLFGRKISLPEDGGGCSGDSSVESDCDRFSEAIGDGYENKAARELSETMTEDEDKSPGTTVESQNTNVLSESDENSKTPSKKGRTASENHPQTENEQSDAGNGQQKTTLKKPDKIIPCPRCNSMDTKFCYYNNYNVNQPRHFCRSCQRYWTAGGTMRNVPVGAGRRKNKNSASSCHHITISEALQVARIDVPIPNGFHHLKFKPNGTVLSFGPKSPLCESMASTLSLTDNRVLNGVVTECSKINNGDAVSCKNGENINDVSVGRPSATMSNSSMEGNKTGLSQPLIQNGFLSPGPCIPGIPWPSWNSGIPLPVVYPPPGYPLPYFPVPYLNYSLPNSLNVPWLSIPSLATTTQAGSSSSPNSPLGKHSRNGELLKPSSSENKGSAKPSTPSPIVVPKTLRIDDPEEAAKSSIWDTLGIKYDSLRREGLFKALQPKPDKKEQMATASPLLQANPAALSRSVNFQETAGRSYHHFHHAVTKVTI